MKRMITVGILAMIASGCSGGASHATHRELTEAQRDSVIARSDLPGAGVVGRAMSESDRQGRRADDMKAMMDSLPR